MLKVKPVTLRQTRKPPPRRWDNAGSKPPLHRRHTQRCSKLYGAACRTTKGMGCERVITYILDSEPGTSLRAASNTRTK